MKTQFRIPDSVTADYVVRQARVKFPGWDGMTQQQQINTAISIIRHKTKVRRAGSWQPYDTVVNQFQRNGTAYRNMKRAINDYIAIQIGVHR